MAIQDYKVSESYSGRDVSSLPNKPNQNGFSAEQLKARFDQLGKEVIPQYNDLIDFLNTNLFSGGSTEGHTHNIDNIEDGVTNRLFTDVEKTKLEGIEAGAEINNISDENATDLTDSGDSTLHYHSSDRNTDNHVSGLTNKVFSATEQNKLQGIQAGAEVNQNAYSVIKVGSNTASAGTKTDTFEIVAGLNIVAVLDTVNKKLTLSAIGDISTLASQSVVIDVGGYYISENVEDVLQEIGLALQNISSDASSVVTDTTNFDKILSSEDTDVQKALEKIDEHVHDGRYYTETEVDALLETKINTDGTNSAIVSLTFSNGTILTIDADRQISYWSFPDGTTANVPSELWYAEGKVIEDIVEGDNMMFAGSQGSFYLLKKAVASELATNPHLYAGVATKPALNGNFIKVTRWGLVNNIDMNGWAYGTKLYFNPITRGFTDVMPNLPNARIYIGMVVKQGVANGILLVDPKDMSLYTNAEIDALIATKQATLVNQSNIKSINGSSILGSGNLDVIGGQMLGNATVKAIAYNAQTIAENITIPSTYNCMSVGPITIADGFTVSLEDGSTWTII